MTKVRALKDVMAKYHVNPNTGNVALCRATKACPFAALEDHYGSREDAMQAYENAYSSVQTLPSKKKTVAKLGSYSIDCPNDSCKSKTHDLRNPEKYLNCARVAAGGSNAKAALYSTRYKQAVDACMRDYYVADLKRAEQEIKLSVELRKPSPESKEYKAAAKALDMLEVLRTSNKPIWLPTGHGAGHLINNLALERDRLQNLGQVKPIAFAPAAKGLNASHGRQNTLVVNKPQHTSVSSYQPKVTLEQMSLKEIYKALAEENKKGETVVSFKRVVAKSRARRMFGMKDVQEVITKLNTERYNEIKDYISNLPPKAKEMAFLYESVEDQDHNDAALDRIDEAFVKTRFMEIEEAKTSASEMLNQSVDQMLKNIESKNSL